LVRRTKIRKRFERLRGQVSERRRRAQGLGSVGRAEKTGVDLFASGDSENRAGGLVWVGRGKDLGAHDRDRPGSDKRGKPFSTLFDEEPRDGQVWDAPISAKR